MAPDGPLSPKGGPWPSLPKKARCLIPGSLPKGGPAVGLLFACGATDVDSDFSHCQARQLLL